MARLCVRRIRVARRSRGCDASEDVVTAFPSKATAWARQLTSVRAARAFVAACEEAGICVLPVKGIVSAVTLNGDLAERPLTDVDVRVVP